VLLARPAPCQSPFPLHAIAAVSPWPWPEEGDQGRRKSQGQKGYFTVLLSPRKPEINILLDGVSSGKFTKNQRVLQQIDLFWVSNSKGWSLSVSSSQFSQFNIIPCNYMVILEKVLFYKKKY
jgi:hypothetical protein